MNKEEERRHSWRTLHNLLVQKTAVKPKFLPSGRLKTPINIDYRDVIEQASRSMVRFKKPERLIRMIVRVIAEQVKVSHTGVILYKKDKGYYELIDSKGVEGKRIPVGYIRIQPDSPLIRVFREKKSFLLDVHDALVYENLNIALKDGGFLKCDPSLKVKINNIKKEMELLRAEICIPAYFKKKLLGILILGHKNVRERFDDEEIGFFATLANDAAIAINNAQLIEDLQEKLKEIAMLYAREHRLFLQVSIALAAAIDARDPYTHGHTERVTHYSLILAGELADVPEVRNNKDFKESLHIAALLHDIGKIGIPDDLLNKKAPLTKKEYSKIKKHPDIGATILDPISELGDIIDVVRAHQERYDGTGYPKGLRGKQIPMMARIITVADAFDAMTTDRPYRSKKLFDKAALEIKANSGRQFDPLVVKAFLRAYQKGEIKKAPPAKY